MEWVRDMTARWAAILRASDSDPHGGGIPLDEAVRQINAISPGPPPSGFGRGRRKRQPEAPPVPAVTVLCRQLVTGVLVSDLLLGRVCELTGQSREEVLDQLTVTPEMKDGQLRVLQAELSHSCESLHAAEPLPEQPSGVSARVTDILRLAEAEAAKQIEQARAEAAKIIAEAREGKPPE